MKILNQYDRLDSVYYSMIDILRYVAFFGLVSISMFLSITFYISAVESILDKILLGSAGAFLESVKVYSLIYAEYVWHSVKLKKKKKYDGWELFRALRPFVLFGALTLLSIVASISFAQASIYTSIEQVQVEIKREAEIEENGNPLIDAKNILLKNKQVQLETLNKRISLLPADYITSSLKLSAEVNQLNEDIYKISEEIANITATEYNRKAEVVVETSEAKETYNRFHLLGKPLGLSETDTLFIFLTLFAVLLELGIIATAPAPDKRSIKELIENRIPKAIITPVKNKQTKSKRKKTSTPAQTTGEVEDEHPKIELEDPGHSAEAKLNISSIGVGVEGVEPKTKTSQIKKRATSLQLLAELYEVGSSYLKSPAQVSYITNRKVEEYLSFLEKLSLIKPDGKTALVIKDKKGYKMNYAFNFIKTSLMNKKGENK